MHKTTVIGNLGADPERRQADGRAVCNFPVAVNEAWKDAQGTPQKRTVWYRVAAWDKLGETCVEHLSKGRKVYVEGRLQADPETGAPRIWTGEDGTAKAAFVLRAERVEFLDSPREQESSSLVDPM